MNNQQGAAPHGFSPQEALHELDGAQRTSWERFMVAHEAVTHGTDMIDRIFPEPATPTVIEPPKGYTREANLGAQVGRAEAVTTHQRTADQFAIPGNQMLQDAGTAYEPLSQVRPVVGTADSLQNDHHTTMLHKIDEIREQQAANPNDDFAGAW
jgi:hypothetical protein